MANNNGKIGEEITAFASAAKLLEKLQREVQEYGSILENIKKVQKEVTQTSQEIGRVGDVFEELDKLQSRIATELNNSAAEIAKLNESIQAYHSHLDDLELTNISKSVDEIQEKIANFDPSAIYNKLAEIWYRLINLNDELNQLPIEKIVKHVEEVKLSVNNFSEDNAQHFEKIEALFKETITHTDQLKTYFQSELDNLSSKIEKRIEHSNKTILKQLSLFQSDFAKIEKQVTAISARLEEQPTTNEWQADHSQSLKNIHSGKKKTGAKNHLGILTLIILCTVAIIAYLSYQHRGFVNRQAQKLTAMVTDVLHNPLQVKIYNGSGVPGLSKAIKAYLENNFPKKIRVIATGNADHFGYEYTQFWINDNDMGKLSIFSSAINLKQAKTEYFLQQPEGVVTIIVGKDYQQIFPELSE